MVHMLRMHMVQMVTRKTIIMHMEMNILQHRQEVYKNTICNNFLCLGTYQLILRGSKITSLNIMRVNTILMDSMRFKQKWFVTIRIKTQAMGGNR